MAYNNYMNSNEGDEGKKSEWNAAALKMKRLHEQQSFLNDINKNLWAYNVDFGMYNYLLHYQTCKSLYAEVDSKLTSEERVEAKILKEKIKIFLENYPVLKIIKSKENKFIQKKQIHIFKVLEVMLEEFELLVRKFLDEHGMDTQYNDDEALF